MNDIVRFFSSKFFSFVEDEESGGIYGVDANGFLLTREELKNLYQKLNIFFDYVGDDEVDKYNKDKMFRIENRITTSKVRQQINKSGWIYIIGDNNGLFKIGMTKRKPDERINEFSPKLPFETQLIYSEKTNDACLLEEKLHEKFSEKRVRGEWFKLTERELEDAISFVTQNKQG